MKGWADFFDWRGAVGFLAIAAAAGLVGKWWLGLPYWIATVIAAAALLANGLIIMWEDRNGP